MSIFDKLAKQLAGGCDRLSIRSCSEWAEEYIWLPDTETKKPRPLSFDYYPHSRGLCDLKPGTNVIMKAAQMACTNSVVYVTFYRMDMFNQSVLYVLPNKIPDAGNFSTGRVNLIINVSPHLTDMFSDVKNDGMKCAGSRTLWVRGSNSSSGLKNIDPNLVILDEYNEMAADKVELAFRRGDGQLAGDDIIALSTPGVPGEGIDEFYQQTTKQHFRFTCPICSQKTELVFPDCLVVRGETLFDPDVAKSHVKCERCQKEIPHERKVEALRKTGFWEATEKGSTAIGWHINQLSSCTLHPKTIARTAIKARYNPFAEQEYWNSHGGLPHAVAGAQLTDENIDEAKKRSNRRRDDRWGSFKFKTMGVDVGNVFHWVIMGWNFTEFGPDLNLSAEAEILNYGWEESLNRIHILMKSYQVPMLVIDSQPDVNGTIYKFCYDHKPHAWRCQFTRGQVGKMMTKGEEGSWKINVHKTHWMDLTMGRYMTGRIKIPVDTGPDFNKHMKNVVKRYLEDGEGDVANDKSKYTSKKPDHWALASCYAEMALPLVASHVSNKNIRSLL